MSIKFNFKLLGILLLLTLFTLKVNGFELTYRNEILSFNQYKSLMSRPLVTKYGNVQGVKVVYDILKKEVYFVNGNLFKYHGDFCKKELSWLGNNDDFNKYNYSTNKNQRFLLANVNYYTYLNKFVLEFGVSNEINLKQIIFLYKQVKDNTFFNDDLYLLKNNKNKGYTKIKNIIDVQDLYLHQTYQPLNKTKGMGRLVFCDKDSVMFSNIKPTDIIVINGSPNILPVVSGVITTDLQGPLSHITLLGINRGIPIMSLKNAWTNTVLKAHRNKKISLIVKQDSFMIKLINNEDLKNKKSTKKNRIKIRKDLDFKILPNADNMSSNMVSQIGAKASYFGLLNEIDFEGKAFIPEGAFAIPFYYYDKHLKSSGAKTSLDSLINYKNELSMDKKKSLLKEIRSKIKQHPVDRDLIREINEKIVARIGLKKVRFRSSTNAEDIKGFNGAGLYSSKSGFPYNEKKSIDNALRKVWSSLWSDRAYYERSLFGISQEDVAMGVLVHKSFPNEEANGVVLTKNLYRENYPGVTVSVQVGETRVVAPNQGVFNDHFLAFICADISYTNQSVSIDWISRSSLNGGNSILTDKEIENLVVVVAKIKRTFYNKQNFFSAVPYDELDLDIEFKIDSSSRKLYIKQVRTLAFK